MKLHWLVSVCLCLGINTLAAADVIPVADFTRHPEIEEASLSPDGLHVAMIRRSEGRKTLQIIRVEGLKPVGAVGLLGDRDVEDLYWPGNDTVVFGLSFRSGSIGKATLTHDLMAVNLDGSKRRALIAHDRKDLYGGLADVRLFRVVDSLPDEPNHMLVQIYEDSYRPYLYRIDVRSGRKQKIQQSHLRGGGFSTDRRGQVRIMYGTEKDGTVVWMHRLNDDSSWTELSRQPPGKSAMRPLGFGPSQDEIYVGDVSDAGIEGLYRINLINKQRTLLAADSDYELAGLLGRNKHDIIGAWWNGERQRWKFFDEKHPDAVFYKALRNNLGGQDLFFVDFSSDGNRAVVAAVSDRQPISYFVVDFAAKGFLMRLPSRPWVNADQMASKTPIEFAARDGLLIRGYLTLPPGQKKGQYGPMVILPHGGPYLRDFWNYDSEAQLLASRGYAVLQPNFRGSSGYGIGFEEAGMGQWGKAMQDDLFDATRWAVSEGFADPKRICIYGASYGAYAALTAVELEPDMFRCAAGYAGVYDLQLIWEQHMSDEAAIHWGRAIGKDWTELAKRSPARHAAQIKVPVFLAHGTEDRIAPISHFEAMRDGLQKTNKPFEELIKKNEGHGFSDEKNREEFYTRLLAFLDRNIGASSGR